MKVDVVLPAAGTSERMNLPVAKQFLKVLGKHILAYTVDCFHRLSWVRHIVITVNVDQIEFTKELMRSYGFSRVIVCAGSHTRHRSIFCGLKALETECSSSDVIIIHDAARPLVSEHVARKVAEAAMSHGAAGVTRPLVSTVIQGNDDDRLVESLDRRLYRNSEMPQAFQYSIITSAYKQSSEDDLDYGTECLLLALKYSQCQAALVKGTDDLWKVTYQKDIYSMESIVKEKLMVVSIMNNCGQKFLALKELESRLYQRQLKIAENQDVPANTFVVVWDLQSDCTLGNVADKICSLYKQEMPSSAVKLGLMVVMVFLQDLHFTHSQTQLNENMSAESPQDGDRSGDQRNSDVCSNGGILDSNAQSLNSDLLLDCSSALCHSSELDNSNTMSATTSSTCSLQHRQGDAANKVLCNDPCLPARLYCKNEYSSSEDNAHFSLEESQRSDILKSDELTSQLEYLDYKFVKSSATLEIPVQANTLSQSKLSRSYRDISRCQIAVRAMKNKLLKDNDGQFALVVGVLCEVKSAIGEQLAELIWQRSLYADSQILKFD